jgi:hypothetical protein
MKLNNLVLKIITEITLSNGTTVTAQLDAQVYYFTTSVANILADGETVRWKFANNQWVDGVTKEDLLTIGEASIRYRLEIFEEEYDIYSKIVAATTPAEVAALAPSSFDGT